MKRRLAVCALALSATCAAEKKKTLFPQSPPSALDEYIRQAKSRYSSPELKGSPGSLWSPGSRLQDLTSDTRAAQVDDLVTIVVSETTSAVSTGATKTARTTSAQSSVTALAGLTKATGPWANLANLGGNQSIDGSGTTSRTTTLTTSMSARVTAVLPNGYLVVEGTKLLAINSERQVITVRGVVRPTDLNALNTVTSANLADLEVTVNGKGVVADSVKRPNILYRILLGLLPF